MKKSDAIDALAPETKNLRKVVEFNESDTAYVKTLMRKTGLTLDMIVWSALQALQENPNGHLVSAVDEHAKRAKKALETMLS